MFTIETTFVISAAHKLNLPYKSKCSEFHGHNWTITVGLAAENTNRYGMIVDFGKIKELLHHLDHSNLNTFIIQPTAENISEYIFDIVERACINEYPNVAIPERPFVRFVDVEESEGNCATYYREY